jgi:6-phosphogluconolactonase (cycloisomerase 2 family)
MTPASVPTGTSVTSEPRSVVVDPTGKYVYVTNLGDDNVSQFKIETGGTLTPIGTGSVATGVRPFFVTVDPSGRYAYVANFWDTTVSQYTIGAADGALTPMSPAATVTVGLTPGDLGERPLSVTVDPQGTYAYVTLYGAKKVLQYTIGAGGALTGNGTPVVSTGNNPWPVAIDPTGQYAYLSNIFDDQIAQYTIGALGALSPMSPNATVDITPNPANPQVIAIDSTGRYAYVVNSGNNSVSQYQIGTGGALTPMGTASVPTGLTPFSITLTR